MIRWFLAFVLFIPLAPDLASAQEDDPLIVTSDSFMRGHPDLRGRQDGLRHYQAGDYEEALRAFRRGARFGDKPSQSMIAQMYWNGQGVDVDRATAYAWMDLAAERHYRIMLVQREVYWEAMNADERERAIPVGEDLYAKYGDVVARPRLEAVLRRERRNAIGGRAGGGSQAASILLITPHGPRQVDASKFYHADYWEPERYREFQDRDWKDLPQGRVEIGPLTSGDLPPAPEVSPPSD